VGERRREVVHWVIELIAECYVGEEREVILKLTVIIKSEISEGITKRMHRTDYGVVGCVSVHFLSAWDSKYQILLND